MSRKPQSNPFYVLVVLTGLAFVLSALFYVVTLVRLQAPNGAASGSESANPLLAFFERQGEWLLLWEAAALALAAFLAMGLDRWRSWRAARTRAIDPRDQFPSTPSSES